MSALAMRSDHRISGPGNMQAGALALLVHLGFFALLAFGLSWQKQEPEAVVVDLWSNLPAPARHAPPPPPAPEAKPEPVKAQPKVEAKAEPKTPAKVEAAKPDIALKATKPQAKPVPKTVEEPKKKPLPEAKPVPDREALLQKQLELLAKQNSAEQARAENARQSAAQQSVIGDYKGRIKRKIRGYLNQRLCGEGNPQLEFEIALFPTGQLRGNPILRKSSGITACDRAVESAIFQSDPLPVPPQPEIFDEFRNLRLVFRPNDPND
jgi:colicin import membrane protein